MLGTLGMHISAVINGLKYMFIFSLVIIIHAFYKQELLPSIHTSWMMGLTDPIVPKLCVTDDEDDKDVGTYYKKEDLNFFESLCAKLLCKNVPWSTSLLCFVSQQEQCKNLLVF